MNQLLIILGYLILLTLLLFAGFSLRRNRRRSAKMSVEYLEMASEEQRMFQFLHELGLAIGKESSDGLFAQMIIHGVLTVVKAKGGLIYREAADRGFLTPSYVSEGCPPLIQIPPEILKESATNPSALQSYMRLARISDSEEGVIGQTLVKGEPLHLLAKDYGMPVMTAPLRYAGKDIGAMVVARGVDENDFCENDFAVFRFVAEQSAFAIGNARLHREATEKKEIEGELKNASEVQRVLLPQHDPEVAGFRINGTNLPARIISGDYYDYIPLSEGKLGIVIADVSGKGVSAGLIMAMCRSILRTVVSHHFLPSRAMSSVNRFLFPDVREDMFISMIYGILDPEEGSFTMARAGHEPALIYRRATGQIEKIKPKGLALGIDPGEVFERITEDVKIYLNSGDCILLYTDGVKEAHNTFEEEFGLERLSQVYQGVAQLGAEAIVQQVQQEMRDFTGGGAKMDDVTIVAIEKR